jgi:O-antigen/teichoic acid export membrane protein
VRAAAIASLLRRHGRYVWGFADQALSSATNFALFLIAGRQLGPHGLGVVTIGISAYLLALGFQRSLLTTPLVSSSAALNVEERSLAIWRGLTIGIVGASGATLLLFALGAVVGGDAGRGFLIVAPWLAFALVQDFWRAVLFQEERARAAAVNDGVWALLMAVTAPLAWTLATDWAIVGCWGVGALAAALFGFAQTRGRPVLAAAFSWWRSHLWPFGRWLALESLTYAAATSGTVFVLYGLIGAADVGGLRAAQSLFAPLSLILPALALPGLPAVVRALRTSPSPTAAFRLATGLSAGAGALAGVYVGVMVLLGGRLIPYVFGESFSGFEDLALPIGAWQLVLAVGAGFGILLTAQQRGRAILLVRGAAAAATITFVSLLAWTNGVVGAAWGYVFGGAAATLLTFALAVHSYGASGAQRGEAPRTESIAGG